MDTTTHKTPKARHKSDNPGKAPRKPQRRRRAYKVIREAWPMIRMIPHWRSGVIRYVVDCRVAGEGGKMTGQRPAFETEDEAKLHAEQKATERRNGGTSSMFLSADQQRDALQAVRRMAERGVKVSLLTAVEGYLRHVAKVEAPATVRELVERLKLYKDSNPKRKLSKRHLDDLRHRLGLFVDGKPASKGLPAIEGFGDRKAHELGHKEIEEWLLALPQGRTTRAKYRTLINLLFNFAKKEGAVGDNPVDKVTEIGKDEPPKGTLTPQQVRKLLACADPSIVPALAIAIFAGLRPESELCRLDWSDIHCKKEIIKHPDGNKVTSYGQIEVKHSKGASGERVVHIQPNLYEWIRRAVPANGEGPVCMGYDRFNALVRDAAITAGIVKVDDNGKVITPWPHDGMRHTFCTMHFAAFRDEPKTMADSGHRSVTTFRKHYCKPLAQKVAFDFWKITPPKRSGKIIDIREAA
jgi:integrase